MKNNPEIDACFNIDKFGEQTFDILNTWGINYVFTKLCFCIIPNLENSNLQLEFYAQQTFSQHQGTKQNSEKLSKLIH